MESMQTTLTPFYARGTLEPAHSDHSNVSPCPISTEPTYGNAMYRALAKSSSLVLGYRSGHLEFLNERAEELFDREYIASYKFPDLEIHNMSLKDGRLLEAQVTEYCMGNESDMRIVVLDIIKIVGEGSCSDSCQGSDSSTSSIGIRLLNSGSESMSSSLTSLSSFPSPSFNSPISTQVLDCVTAPIWIADKNGKVVYTNEGFQDLIDLPPMSPGWLYTITEKNKRIVLKTKNENSLEEFLINCRKVYGLMDKDDWHYVGSLSSVRTTELDDENENRSKSRFIATISHEMKTPLTCLAGAVSLLETTALNDEQLELIATLNFCSKTLNILINNILDYGKINEEQFFLEPVEFDLRHLLKETMSLVGLQAQSKEIDLRVEFDRRLEEQNLYADEFRIKQIILNLLTNAIKFTGKGGFVDLAVGLVEEPEASFIKFTIKDNGIGIQKQKQRQVFQPFSQFHSKKYGGSGLGLAISKKLVEKMGGCIWFESQENVGSVFAFTIRQNRQFRQKSDTFRPKTTYPVSFILTRNRGMSLYLEGVLKRASVTLNVVPVADEAELFRNISKWDGNKNEILVIEEMVNPDDRAQKAISDLIMQGLRWVRIRCPGSSKQLLPCIRNKITKPFISNDLVQLILDPPMSQVQPKIVNNSISIMGSKDRCNRESLRILLVDDNATILSVLGKMLSKLGYVNVQMCRDGKDAVDLLEDLAVNRKPGYHLIFMDMKMTAMNGDEAATRIRSIKHIMPQPHIIALTANVLNEDKETCIAAGMCGFASKPINMQTVSDIIRMRLDDSFTCTSCLHHS